MSSSFTISGSIGTHVFAEDVLFTSSHPLSSALDTHWTKNPQYAPISIVPLKASVLDQFRRTARAVSGENESLADIETLQKSFEEKRKLIAKMEPVSSEMRNFVSNNEFDDCNPSAIS
jgi:hypothetical protein